MVILFEICAKQFYSVISSSSLYMAIWQNVAWQNTLVSRFTGNMYHNFSADIYQKNSPLADGGPRSLSAHAWRSCFPSINTSGKEIGISVWNAPYRHNPQTKQRLIVLIQEDILSSLDQLFVLHSWRQPGLSRVLEKDRQKMSPIEVRDQICFAS